MSLSFYNFRDYILPLFQLSVLCDIIDIYYYISSVSTFAFRLYLLNTPGFIRKRFPLGSCVTNPLKIFLVGKGEEDEHS